MGTRDRPWNRSRTNDEFLDELYDYRQDVKPIDDYPGSRTKKMHFKCLKCGHIFETTPVLILNGRKCDNCKPRKIKYDLTGQKFGKLTVVEIDNSKNINGKLYWKCKCDYISCNVCSQEWAFNIVRM